MKSLILFGASGGLGAAINAAASEKLNLRICPVSWANASTWTPDDISAWFDNNVGGNEADILFANGLTDPAMSRDDLMESNFLFPQRVINTTRRRRGLRYMTFGSVLEQMHNADGANAYFSSKIELSGFIEGLAATGTDRQLLHLRLHTLFGSPKPHSHMFIGQISDSLRSNTLFEMTSGRQYRQYHHVDDIAQAIVRLLGRHWQTPPIVDINGEETFQLADLATAIFGHFGKSGLLKIGALPTPARDVLAPPNYPPTKSDLLPFARPTLPGLCAWLESLGIEKQI